MSTTTTTTTREMHGAADWRDELLSEYPGVFDPASVRRALELTEDREHAAEICAREVPAFPAPRNAPLPEWAESGTDWEWHGLEQRWVRTCWRHYGLFDIAQHQYATSPETTTLSASPDVLFGLDELDLTPPGGPGELRALAFNLLAAADVLDGPDAVRSTRDAEPTQYRVVKAIRTRLLAMPLGQNELAVAAGYSTSELSQLMTGRRVMDLVDVDRIATALGTDALSLLNEGDGAE